ncbi:MerR family transcriptional regulator [Nocardia arthritidis]|uniref:MerR family transcriptional regulator n=1 Tax=Nocardia arthritidis TaxID=228602 RepID=A0A6G9Y8V0_9NOCA|nr:MerR family transcriptional regulator [Nocardia arthritidis]
MKLQNVDVATDELITIGALARSCGLTPSALRFYDDCGLLAPARVDAATGYRYYAESQRERAVLIRQLREIGLPLEQVARILTGSTSDAEKLLDDHVAELDHKARTAAELAPTLKRLIGSAARHRIAVPGPALARAIEQVWPAAARDPEIPVLTGILVEATADSLTLTATDRYRLSTRGIAPRPSTLDAWTLVVAAGELAAITAWLRSAPEVELDRRETELLVTDGSATRGCTVIDETFPDYRSMLTALAPVRTRVVLARELLMETTETLGPVPLSIDAATQSLTAGKAARLPATVTGPSIDITFDSALLRSAVSTALGPEVMLEISAADQPVVVRSATDGELTTLAMPIRDNEGES